MHDVESEKVKADLSYCVKVISKDELHKVDFDEDNSEIGSNQQLEPIAQSEANLDRKYWFHKFSVKRSSNVGGSSFSGSMSKLMNEPSQKSTTKMG